MPPSVTSRVQTYAELPGLRQLHWSGPALELAGVISPDAKTSAQIHPVLNALLTPDNEAPRWCTREKGI